MNLDRLSKLFWYFVSLIVRCFTRVHSNRILCWSYYGNKYSCNPYYITKYLLENHPGKYEIYWFFEDYVDVSNLPKEVHVVHRKTFKYCIIANTAKFVICNARTGMLSSGWLKRKSQRYIMTWHSSMGVKRIEKDVQDELDKNYVNACKYDSHICDLILSGCKFRSDIIKRAFWYDGPILEEGTPRNDMLFDKTLPSKLKAALAKKLGFDVNDKILLYAPTFRRNRSIECYRVNWNDVISELKRKTGDDYVVLLRLHPSLINRGIDYSSLMVSSKMYDVTLYHDMQELLSISDILVTDYSSSIFDFSLLYKPCFIYAPDYDTYDRGTYLKLNQLPYPFARDQKQFLHNIESFDNDKYRTELSDFLTNTIGTYEKGHACESFYQWMLKQ